MTSPRLPRELQFNVSVHECQEFKRRPWLQCHMESLNTHIIGEKEPGGQCAVGVKEVEESRALLTLQGAWGTVVRVRDRKARGSTSLRGKLPNVLLNMCSFEHMPCQALG